MVLAVLSSFSKCLPDSGLLFLTLTLTLITVSYYYSSNLPEGSGSLVDKYLNKTINICNLLFRTILFIPTLHCLLGSLTQTLTVSVLPKWLWTVVGVVGIAEFVIVMLLVSIMAETFNPFCTHPWSCPTSFNSTIKSLIKITIVLFAQSGDLVNPRARNSIQTVLCLCWLVYNAVFFQLSQKLQRTIWKVILSCTLWNYLFLLIKTINMTDFYAPVFRVGDLLHLLMGMLFTSISVQYLCSYVNSKQIVWFLDKNDPRCVMTGVFRSIWSIEDSEYLAHFSNHLAKCVDVDCVCKDIVQRLASRQ